MKKRDESLISLINPSSNSTIMIYDVHASESGALAILNDLYCQIREYEDKSVKWVFIVSIPEYEETECISVRRFPWVKKNWGNRCYFDVVKARRLLKEYQPDQVFSLQNRGISFYHKRQLVYLHLPFVLTDHKFKIKTDGIKLWLYQNIVSKSIFKSLRTVDLTIVQTHWMKEALIKKAHVPNKRIVIQKPDITCNRIEKYVDCPENRKRFFYPATAFTYKNHITILKALMYAQDRGFHEYEMIFTIKLEENKYTRWIGNYAQKHNLNVCFEGSIPRKKVFEMYAKSVLVFPSYVESFGLPLLEARMTGTPVIASDTTFCHEILDGYDKAVFFPEMDYETLGKILLQL